jgi:hypothetical protein
MNRTAVGVHGEVARRTRSRMWRTRREDRGRSTRTGSPGEDVDRVIVAAGG